MNTRNLLLLSLSVILLGVLSCKKKKNDNPFSTAKITVADVTHQGSIVHHRIYYDAYSNVDSISSIGAGTSMGHNTYKKFHYYGSSFDITDEANYTFTVYAYSNGLMFKVLIPDTIGLIYNGMQLGAVDVFTHTTTYPYYLYTRTNYNWKNGDLNTVVTGGVTVQYNYDAGKFGQPGDPLRVVDLLKYGRSVIKTTHLPTDVTKSGVWAEKYFYEFDNQSRISQLMKVINNNSITADDTTIYQYTY